MSDIFGRPQAEHNFEGYRPRMKRLNLRKTLTPIKTSLDMERALEFLDSQYEDIRKSILAGNNIQMSVSVVEFGSNASNYLQVHYKP